MNEDLSDSKTLSGIDRHSNAEDRAFSRVFK